MRNFFFYLTAFVLSISLFGCSSSEDSTAFKASLSLEKSYQSEEYSQVNIYLEWGEEQIFIDGFWAKQFRKLTPEEFPTYNLPKGAFDAVFLESGSEFYGDWLFWLEHAGASKPRLFQKGAVIGKEVTEVLPELMGQWVSYEFGYYWMHFTATLLTDDQNLDPKTYFIEDRNTLVIEDNPPSRLKIVKLDRNTLIWEDAFGKRFTFDRKYEDPAQTTVDPEAESEFYQGSYEADFELFKAAVLENKPFDWEHFVEIEGQSGADYQALFQDDGVQFALRLSEYHRLPRQSPEGPAVKTFIASTVGANDEIIRQTFLLAETPRGLRLVGFSVE